MQFSVISKGKKPRYFDNFATVRQYLVVKAKNGKKYLLVKISNDRNETLTSVKVTVKQLNARGENVGIVEREFNGLSVKYRSRFVPEAKIELSADTVGVDVRVADAYYGDNKLSAKGQTIVSTYEKQEEHIELTKREINNLSGGKKFTTNPRRFRVPKGFTVFAVSLLAVMFAVTAVKVFDFSKKSTEFLLSQVKYEFIDGDKSKGSPIRLSGFKGNPKKVVVPAEIEGHPVVEIEESAFIGNKSVKTVKIEGSPVVGASAFKGCSSLTSVDLGSSSLVGESAFESCPLLTSLTAKGLESLGASAFKGCASLSTISIENAEKVLTIGDSAFDNCPSVKEIVINQPVSYASGTDWFASSSAVEKIHLYNYNYTELDEEGKGSRQFTSFFGAGATEPKTTLAELKITNMDGMPVGFLKEYTALTTFEVENFTETVLRDGVFDGCTSLTTLSIPTVMTEIGAGALAGTQITEFDCSKAVTIGDRAFENASLLTSTFLANNKVLTSLGASAFAGCSELKTVHIPSGITIIPSYAFADCTSLTTVTFAKDTAVTEISKGAFSGVSSLAAISLPYTTAHIKDEAFKGCTSLISISFHKNLKQIHNEAFAGCTSLSEFTVPTNVEYLGMGVISGCTSLEKLTVPYIGETMSTNNRINFLFGALEAETTGLVPVSLKEIEVTQTLDLDESEEIVQNEIPDYAFYDCVGLVKTTLVEGVTQIGEYAYGNCYALPELPFKGVGGRPFEGIEAVGKYAFSNCTSLTSADIPSTLVNIGDGVLTGCTALTTFEVDSFRVTSEESELPVSNFGKLFGSPEPQQNKEYIPASITTIKVNSRTIEGNKIPTNAFYGFTGATQFVFPESVIVNSLGANAFRDCLALNFIPYVDSLSEIGSGAFAGCTSLTTVGVTANLEVLIGSGAFAGCSSLSTLVIPSLPTSEVLGYLFEQTNQSVPESLKKVTLINQTSLGTGAFSGCRNIEEVDLQGSVTNIGATAFKDCVSLERVVIPDTVSSIGQDAFAECYRLFEVIDLRPLSTLSWNNYDEFSQLGKYALSVFNNRTQTLRKELENGCEIAFGQRGDYLIGFDENLTRLVLPERADEYSIVWKLFEGNSTVTNIAIGNSVKRIEDNAFWGSTALKEVTIGSNLESLGKTVFSGCVTLSSLTISSDAPITIIPNSTFENCFLLSSVSLPSSLVEIGEGAFRNDSKLPLVVLPSSITKIGRYAFEGCSALQTADMPTKLQTIGDRAFYGTSLQAVVFAETTNLTEIGSEAFANNIALHSVRFPEMGSVALCDRAFENTGLLTLEIPSSVTSIGSRVFAGCVSLATVKSETADIGSYTFSGATALTTVSVKNAYVENGVFGGCEAISSVVFENSTLCSGIFSSKGSLVKASLSNCEVKEQAFAYCSALRSVRLIGNNRLEDDTFVGSDGILEVYDLGSLVVEKGAETNGQVALHAIIIHTDANAEELKDVTIDEFNYHKSGSFWYLYSYNNQLPTELEIRKANGYDVIIAPEVFQNTGITKLNLSGVKEVGDYAFANCFYLNSVTIGPSVTKIATGNLVNAFYGCTRIKEVYNLGALSVTKGEENNGLVARYALRVNRNASDPAIEYHATSDRYSFYHLPVKAGESENGWYLESAPAFSSSLVEMPIGIETGTKHGGTINSYRICDGVLYFSNYYTDLILPVGIELRNGALSAFSSAPYGIYYKGSSSDWNDYAFTFTNYNTVRFYQECIHAYTNQYWRYDAQGNITTDVVYDYEYKLKEEIAPTCVKDGKLIYACPNEKCSVTREEILGHMGVVHNIEGGKCQICLSEVIKDLNGVSGKYEIENDSEIPFEFDENGYIVCVGNDDGTSELVITTLVRSRLTFIFGVEGGIFDQVQILVGSALQDCTGHFDMEIHGTVTIKFSGNADETATLMIANVIIAELE